MNLNMNQSCKPPPLTDFFRENKNNKTLVKQSGNTISVIKMLNNSASKITEICNQMYENLLK